MLRGFEISWPQALVGSVAMVALAAVYLFAPDDARMELGQGLAVAWAVVASVLGPLFQGRDS